VLSSAASAAIGSSNSIRVPVIGSLSTREVIVSGAYSLVEMGSVYYNKFAVITGKTVLVVACLILDLLLI